MSSERTGSPSDPQPPRFLGPWGLVRVQGRSMEPTFRAEDVLLVRRGNHRAGQVAVIRLPGERPLSVKRLVKREADGWWVERDNPREGVDSWSVGAIAEIDVVAHVVARVWPLRRSAHAG